MRAVRLALSSLLIATGATGQAIAWRQVASTGPVARYSHAMAYDSQRARAVLFGGVDNIGGNVLNDTWEWSSGTWTQTNLPGPFARFDHAMVYDSFRGSVVLFGGFYPGDMSTPPQPLRDTWEYIGGVGWTLSSFSGPPARFAHAMAYDSLRHCVVLFGGLLNQSGSMAQDTWEWNGSFFGWTLVASTGPSPRYWHGMAFDSFRGRTVLFGGIGPNGGIGANVALGDTWEWNGAAWVQTATAGPGNRHSPGMAFDSNRGLVVLFGGSSGATIPTPANDTWDWDGATWRPSPVAMPPTSRYQHAMVYEAHRHQVLMFGGLSGAGPLGDTWERGPAVTTATATAYGAGCGSPPLTISAVTPPILGTIQDTLIANIPGAYAFMAIGFSASSAGGTPLPIALDSLGMPGCLLHHDAAYTLMSFCTAPSGGSALHSLAIPIVPAFIGAHAYLEAWAAAPGVNAFGAITSNAIDLMLGDV